MHWYEPNNRIPAGPVISTRPRARDARSALLGRGRPVLTTSPGAVTQSARRREGLEGGGATGAGGEDDGAGFAAGVEIVRVTAVTVDAASVEVVSPADVVVDPAGIEVGAAVVVSGALVFGVARIVVTGAVAARTGRATVSSSRMARLTCAVMTIAAMNPMATNHLVLLDHWIGGNSVIGWS
jgi:hypothetical protein